MPEIKRIKQLEEESRKQKQMVGEQAMIKLNAISAILFDLGDTLITRTSDHTKCKIDALNEVHELLSKVGNSIPVQEFQELEDTMWKKMKEDYGREQLEFKMDIFINNLLLEVNVDRDDRAKLIPQISKIIYKHDLRSLVLNKYVDEVLKTLKQKKYILGIITNTSYSYQHIINILDNFQIRKYFKNVVVSSVEEVCKPNPKIFLKALEDLNVQPVNAVYVGNDLQVDIEGAINVGMKAIYISERGSRKMKESNHQNVRVASDIREVIHHVEGYIREVYAGKTDQKLESETRGLENALARAIYEYLYRTVEYSPFFTSRVNEQIRFFYFINSYMYHCL